MEAHRLRRITNPRRAPDSGALRLSGGRAGVRYVEGPMPQFAAAILPTGAFPARERESRSAANALSTMVFFLRIDAAQRRFHCGFACLRFVPFVQQVAGIKRLTL